LLISIELAVLPTVRLSPHFAGRACLHNPTINRSVWKSFYSSRLLEHTDIFLPRITVKLHNLRLLYREIIVVQDSHIHSVEIRCGAWPGEDVNAAVPAEMMLGNFGTKLVGAKL
jgi:hypothetical protein